MEINQEIKNQIQNLQENGKIWEVSYSENLDEIKLSNNTGKWKLKKCEIDICDCGEKSHYMAILDGFTQSFQCKKCLLHSLKNYDNCGWEIHMNK